MNSRDAKFLDENVRNLRCGKSVNPEFGPGQPKDGKTLFQQSPLRAKEASILRCVHGVRQKELNRVGRTIAAHSRVASKRPGFLRLFDEVLKNGLVSNRLEGLFKITNLLTGFLCEFRILRQLPPPKA